MWHAMKVDDRNRALSPKQRGVMRDYLAWRLAFGITTPSTNTVVQPEYDDMRPEGVTNHIARMVIEDNPVRSDADFEKQLEEINASLEAAVDRVMDAKPNAFILGISALSVWGGTPEWGEELKRRVRAVAGFDVPVTISSDAVVAGLKAHGVKRKIAVMEPYYPCIEPRLKGVLGAHGFEIVRFCHMRGKSPASYSVLTAKDMIDAAKSIDGDDVEALVAFGANLPFAKLADEAERWLDKPVLQVNATTYWHALRTNGIADKIYGYGRLLAHY
jgi:maleate isomerase